MELKDSRIDGGTGFDFGKTSADYARFRDIYPPAFYAALTDRGLCVSGQHVLDLGTGTGVLPRAMYRFGADWTGTDISPEQIAEAKRLSAEAGMQIRFAVSAAEKLDFPAESFDAVTACQCFWYFDAEQLLPQIRRMLKPNGALVIMQMMWLPFEDKIAGESERLVLRFSPNWTGGGETRHPVYIPECADKDFTVESQFSFDLPVHFTRETWHGRMRACRGVGASLSGEKLLEWDAAHRALLEDIAPPEFDILHYAAFAVLRAKSYAQTE